MSIGIRIKEIRKIKGLNAEEFAKKAGTSPAYLRQLESDTKKPGAEILCNLLVNLKVNINYLLAGIGTMFIPDPIESAEQFMNDEFYNLAKEAKSGNKQAIKDMITMLKGMEMLAK